MDLTAKEKRKMRSKDAFTVHLLRAENALELMEAEAVTSLPTESKDAQGLESPLSMEHQVRALILQCREQLRLIRNVICEW